MLANLLGNVTSIGHNHAGLLGNLAGQVTLVSGPFKLRCKNAEIVERRRLETILRTNRIFFT